MPRSVFGLCLIFVVAPFSTVLQAADEAVDFEREIRPIFAAKCLNCHGPEKSQGGLRLDLKRHAFGPTDSGTPAITAGKTDDSELLRRVSSEDDGDRMPPEGDPLTVNQVAALRRWIAAGAAWPAEKEGPQHWAWQIPVRPTTPEVRDAGRAKNALDHFVLAKLDQEKLKPSREADPAVLCRRLYLDLTGLPPTPAEVDGFVAAYTGSAANSEKAYAALVDKLLASPHYGERWARPWLDLARYADSNGFQRDGFRTMWAYRDWIVRSFNEDLPYTEFVKRQLAGDLLTDATTDTKIATGFNRCTTVNVEAGTDPEENRVLAVVDRVNTATTVFLGATLACAQCHNHKYDPFTQVEYYKLLAYFNNTEAEIKPSGSRRDFTGPSLALPVSAEQAAKQTSLEQQLKVLEARLSERSTQAADMEKKLLATRSTAPENVEGEWQVLTPTAFESAGGATPVTLDDGSVLLTEDRPDKDVYTVTVRTKLRGISAFKLEALTDDSLPGKGPGRGDAERPNFVLTEFTVKASPTDDANAAVDVGLYGATADFSQTGHDAGRAIDGKLDRAGWAINPQFHKPHEATFLVRTPIDYENGAILKFQLHQNFGTSRTIGRLRVSARTDRGTGGGLKIPAEVAAVLDKPAKKRTKAESEKLHEFCLSLDPEVQQMRDVMSKARKELDGIKAPTTLVMIELEQPRMTSVMKRGNFLDLGPQVQPGVPAALHPLPENAPPNRLGLALWMADEKNPLLARVAVNRWWAELFGRGIVASQEDFGTQCEPPTHPELLDWLAVELKDSGWSMKHVLKTIVTSATYRQSAKVDPALLKRDPYNLLYARGPRFRLPAETIRDNTLAAAGLLSRKLGGPPVFPPQPDGIWRVTGEVDNNYYTSAGEDRYRRGLYTIWRRSAPYPSFVNFDAPDRSSCVVARPRTNTPLQALTLLNDPVFVEAAGALAQQMAKESPSAEVAARIEHGFRLLLARKPSPVESELLVAAYRRELELYSSDLEKAKKVLASAKLTAEESATAEMAALFHVANLLLNLDEAVTKG